MASKGDINKHKIQPPYPRRWGLVSYDEVLEKTKIGIKLKSKDLNPIGIYPVIDQGAQLIAGYVDDEELLYGGDLPVVIFGDHTKNIKYIDFKFAIGADGTKLLKPKKGIGERFLYYNLQSLRLPDFGYSRHFSVFKALDFPLPPLPEQERIVAKLDKLFAQHEKIKQALDRIRELLKDFRNQVLTHAVTGKLTEQWREGKELEDWKKKELQEVAKIVDPHPSHRTPPEFENGVPYISIGDIDANKEINFEKARKVNPTVLREHISRYTLKLGDFIFGKIGTIGKPIKIPVEQNYCLSANVILIQPKVELVSPEYVYIYLDSPYLLAKVMEKAVATSQAAYGIKKMRVELINIPSLQEQQEIVRRVESLFTKANIIETRHQELKGKVDILPQAILHKAFKGELVPQFPMDGDTKDLLEDILALKEETKGKRGKR